MTPTKEKDHSPIFDDLQSPTWPPLVAESDLSDQLQGTKQETIDPTKLGFASDDSAETSDGPSPAPTTDVIPDGGLKAWMQVVGSFCLYFNTWGLISCYGAFEAIYELGVLKDYSPFQVSVIGSLQSFLTVFLGLVTGPAYDAGYFHHLVAIGSVLLVVGTVLQSFCTQYWQFVLAQGALVGLGSGCLLLPATATPSMWFSKNLPIANGISASGSGLGGVLIPIMLRELHERVGLYWAIRVIALLLLVLLGIANLTLRPRGPGAVKKKPRSLIDTTALRDWPYLLFLVGGVAAFLGMYTPFVYIQSYTLDLQIASSNLALYMLAILNASSIFGRIVPTLLAQRLGPMNMIVGTLAILGVACICLTAVDHLPGLIVAVLVYGFFTGTFFALQPTIVVRLTADPTKIGTRFGMAFAVYALGILFGPPISGALRSEFGYGSAWIWSGVVLMLGGFLIALARLNKTGMELKRQI